MKPDTADTGKNPDLTIGITTYNNPDPLKETLEDIINQTYKNSKIIIGDNCSNDDRTQEIASGFANNDQRMEYVRHPENLGYFANLSYLIKRADTEYFMWAADDDRYNPQYIEKCIDTLNDNPEYGLVFTRFRTYSPQDRIWIFLNHNLYLRSRYKKTIFLLLDEGLTHKANMLYGVWRTEVIQKVLDRCAEYGVHQEHIGHGFDNAFLTVAVGLTGVYQIQEKLFTKRYLDRNIPGSLKSYAVGFAYNCYSFIKNPVRYIKNMYVSVGKQMELVESVYDEKKTIKVRLVLFTKKMLHIFFRFVI